MSSLLSESLLGTIVHVWTKPFGVSRVNYTDLMIPHQRLYVGRLTLTPEVVDGRASGFIELSDAYELMHQPDRTPFIRRNVGTVRWESEIISVLRPACDLPCRVIEATPIEIATAGDI